MPALRRCSQPGCPELTGTRWCVDHERAHYKRRGTPSARGYDTRHYRERTRIAARITVGHTVHCVRCGQPITTSNDLDLGHTDDRDAHSGPEHARCNRSAAGRKSHDH